MSAGGTWTVQNKVRPGAYINFVSVPKPVGTLGERGTVAVGMPMTWGPTDKIIRLTGDELLNGTSLAKVGTTAMDTEASLPYRVALAGCFTALLFRTDVGGTKATAELTTDKLSVNAKYAGTSGNNLAVVIVKDKPEAGSYTIQVMYSNILKESFIVKNVNDLKDIESEFVDFVVSEEATDIPATAGTALTGGTNGTVSSDQYATFLKLLDTQNFQSVAIYGTDGAIPSTLKEKVEIWREKRGKKVQAVVYNYTAADYEGIISVNQGFKTPTDTVDQSLFPVWVASMTAGAQVNQSLTAAAVEGATEIINPIGEDEIEDALNTGCFVLSYRQDGAVCVEKDINSLHTFTADKNYAFSKNRVIRCLDEIANSVSLAFNRSYAGKVDNDSHGRDTLKAEIITLMDSLSDMSAIQNFEGADDITVMPGESVDSVVIDIAVQPVDSMEKLYMTVNVDA